MTRILFSLLFAAALPLCAQTPAPSPSSQSPGDRLNAESRQVIVAAIFPKSEAYNGAYRELNAAGGVSAAGLTTKEAIAARRTLIDACVAANEDLIAFLNNEPQVLREELAKVQMEPAKIDEYVAHFVPDPPIAAQLEVRSAAKETLVAMKAVLDVLDETFGGWTAGETGTVSFKKKDGMKRYSAAYDAYRKAATAQNEATAKLKANSSPASAAAPSASAAATAAP